MDRKSFDNLSNKEQIEYINKNLSEGSTITKICQQIGIGRSTVSDRAERVGYKYNKRLNQYIKHKSSENKADKNEDKVTNKTENNAINEAAADSILNVDITAEVYQNIIKIADNADVIMKIIKEFESRKTASNMALDTRKILQYGSEFHNRSYNINKKIEIKFAKFCKEHKNFRQQDLISLALLEFIEKYK